MFSRNTILSQILAKIRGGTGLAKAGADYYGLGQTRFYSADQSGAQAAVTDAPHGGEYIVVSDIVLSVGSVAITVNIIDEVTNTVMMTLFMPVNSTQLINPNSAWKLPSADSQLMVQTNIAGDIAITAFYKSEK